MSPTTNPAPGPAPHLTLAELERHLAGGPHGVDHLGGRPDLVGIRRAGVRRRRVRRAAASLAALAVVGVAATGTTVVLGGSGERAVEPAATVDHTRLSELAQRALEEIPGAEQLDAWQVLLPAPEGAAPEMFADEEPFGPERVTGEPVQLQTPWYAGVTAYQPGDFPAWLYQGVQRIERSMGDEEGGYPVGSTDVGLLVDAGSLELVCATAWDWNEDVAIPGQPCHPAVLGVDGSTGERQYLWGMGTDSFLGAGAPMELFDVTRVDDGRPREWIGGLDGTSVTRVVLEDADGHTSEATVSTGELVPGETMFWGTVPGELAVVTAYDADGGVVEEHPLKPCGSPVECEVR